MDGEILTGFVTNLGFFGPAAFLGWWIINKQRQDLLAQRDDYLEQLKTERDRNAALTDRVIALAQSGERTVAELTAAVRGPH